jgi:hypothetical protein
LRQNKVASTERSKYVRKATVEFNLKKPQLALAVAIQTQQQLFVDERLFEKAQILNRPLREMEKTMIVRDVQQDLSTQPVIALC